MRMSNLNINEQKMKSNAKKGIKDEVVWTSLSVIGYNMQRTGCSC